MTPQTEQAERLAGDAVPEQVQAATVQKPTICRIVVFHDHNEVEWPAIVQAVNADGSIDLAIFRGQHYAQVQRVTEGTERNNWSWPPRG